MFRTCFSGVALACGVCFLFSCNLSRATHTVHLHDRHRLSAPVIAEAAAREGGGTLVLLDYHHDCSVDPSDDGTLSSYDWAGRLLEDSVIDRILWLSGRTLLEPNRESRMHWLNRSLEQLPPSRAQVILARIELVDWHDLEKKALKGPVFVSLDLDVLTVDPGPDPAAFLDELLHWIQTQRVSALTVAFSAAYQKSPRDAWSWLLRTIQCDTKWNWVLEAEGPVSRPESFEEQRALERWNNDPLLWRGSDGAFYPGESLWIHAPLTVQTALMKSGVTAGDSAAERVLSGWKDAELASLREEFNPAVMEAFAREIEHTAMTLLNGNDGLSRPRDERGYLDVPESVFSPEGGKGMAVRFLSRGIDRGCLAIWRGIGDFDAALSWCTAGALSDPRYPAIQRDELDELELEISLFGSWHVMKNPRDFRPGTDSLLLEGPRGVTLLQASLARDRQLDDVSFLETLSAKAGLGPDGWKDDSLQFFRSVTCVYRRPFSSSQINVKK